MARNIVLRCSFCKRPRTNYSKTCDTCNEWETQNYIHSMKTKGWKIITVNGIRYFIADSGK